MYTKEVQKLYFCNPPSHSRTIYFFKQIVETTFLFLLEYAAHAALTRSKTKYHIKKGLVDSDQDY